MAGSKYLWEDATSPREVPVDLTDPHPEGLPLCRSDKAVISWKRERMCKRKEVRALGATWPQERATSKGLSCQKKFAALVRGAASSRKQGSGDGPARGSASARPCWQGGSISSSGICGSSAPALSSLLSESLGEIYTLTREA